MRKQTKPFLAIQAFKNLSPLRASLGNYWKMCSLKCETEQKRTMTWNLKNKESKPRDKQRKSQNGSNGIAHDGKGFSRPRLEQVQNVLRQISLKKKSIYIRICKENSYTSMSSELNYTEIHRKQSYANSKKNKVLFQKEKLNAVLSLAQLRIAFTQL